MASSSSRPVASSRLLVLYASQTGNAMDAAEHVGREAERGGCLAVDVLSMDSFNPSCLSGERFMVFVVSTMGQGEPPDSMKGFWKYLLRKHLGVRWLERLHYAVFGLGDSGYQKYNFPAKKLDQRLLGLGAERIIEKGLGDDQHPSGYEGALDPWLLSLWRSVNQTNPSLLPRISDTIHPNFNILRDAKVEVIYYSAPQDTNISDSKKLIERARSMSPALKFHNYGEPQYMLHMVTNQRLTKEDSDRDVRHFELEDPCDLCSLFHMIIFAPNHLVNDEEIERLFHFCHVRPSVIKLVMLYKFYQVRIHQLLMLSLNAVTWIQIVT